MLEHVIQNRIVLALGLTQVSSLRVINIFSRLTEGTIQSRLNPKAPSFTSLAGVTQPPSYSHDNRALIRRQAVQMVSLSAMRRSMTADQRGGRANAGHQCNTVSHAGISPQGDGFPLAGYQPFVAQGGQVYPNDPNQFLVPSERRH